MLGWDAMAARAAAAGLEFSPYESVPRWPDGVTQDNGWDDLMIPRLHGRRVADDIVGVAREYEPDVLVIDCMMGAGYDAAAELQLPTAVLVHVLYGPFVDLWGDHIMRREVRALLSGADRVLALTHPGFDHPREDLPANTSYVGPITSPDDPALVGADVALLDAPGDPWVLLSLSTTLQGQLEMLPRILAAVETLPVRVLLTLGNVFAADALAVPDNVVVRDYLPHARVLPWMSMVITHGGLSSVSSALEHGVPLLCIPQGREQPLNAARVVECGVGRVVDADSSPPQIAAAAVAVLGDTALRSAAARFAGSSTADRAAQTVADLLAPRERGVPSFAVPAGRR